MYKLTIKDLDTDEILHSEEVDPANTARRQAFKLQQELYAMEGRSVEFTEVDLEAPVDPEPE